MTVSALIDILCRGLRPYLLLSALCAILYGPGLSGIPPLDRDESRFMQATRQMLESGDFIRVRFQEELRAKKPAGAYWLQAVSVRALSHPLSTQAWPYRLPGALAAWAAVLMTFAFGRGALGVRPALLGAAALAASAILIAEAHQAKTDAILLASIVAAQTALGRIYLASAALRAGRDAGLGGQPQQGRVTAPGLIEALTFWLALGVGILIKGPVAPMISLLTIAALAVADRGAPWLIRLHPVTGLILTASIAAPWFIAVNQATQGAFVGQAIKNDLLPKLLGAQEAHGGLPGMYLVLSPLLLWPVSLVALPAMVSAWSDRKRLAYRFLLAWALPCWLMFELVPTKLPHYVLPAFPAILLITGAKLTEGFEGFQSRWTRLFALFWTVIGLALAAAAIWLPVRFGAGFDPATLPIAVGIVLAVILAAWAVTNVRHPETALAACLLAAIAAWPPLLTEVAPRLDHLWVSREAGRLVDELAVREPVAVAGYAEPSLVFQLGTKTLLTDGQGAARHLAQHPHAIALVAGGDIQAAFTQEAATLGLSLDSLGQVEGLNYSRGKAVILTAWGVKGP